MHENLPEVTTISQLLHKAEDKLDRIDIFVKAFDSWLSHRNGMEDDIEFASYEELTEDNRLYTLMVEAREALR